jgi:hypothetical protein
MLSETVAGALRHAWAAVGELGLPAAVMGGIALSAWRHPRNTRDADLLIGLPTTEPDAILHGMQAHGFRPMRLPALVVVGPSRFFQLLYTPPGMFVDIKTDLLLADSTYQQTALNRRRPFEWPEFNLKVEVLTCEDLILHKLLAGRVIDRADVVALQMANRAILDYRYLGDWLRQLSLANQWTECWAEASPGEPDPTKSS